MIKHIKEFIRKYDLLEWLTIAAFFGLVLIMMFLQLSCVPHNKINTTLPVSASNSVKTIVSTIHTTDWLTSIFLVGIVICLFAAFNGLPKAGYSGALSIGAGLFLKAGLSNVWVWTISGIILVCSLVIGIVSIFIKSRALKEVVGNVEDFKKVDPGIWDYHKLYDNGFQQSKETQTVVKKIKKKLRNKDESAKSGQNN